MPDTAPSFSDAATTDVPHSRMPVLFIAHGGGPCFQMPDPVGCWTEMGNFLKDFPSHLPAVPKALVVISAHWEESTVAVTAASQHPLLYDYNNFPPHTYELKWPAAGHPELANRVISLISDSGIPAKQELVRGLDHGVFVPLLLSYPEASIPTIEVSLNSSLDPALHYKLGEALQPLRDEGYLIIASGFTYHGGKGYGDITVASNSFDTWLNDSVCHKDVSERKRILTTELNDAPGFRVCHPREEHLIPVHVAAGAAGADVGFNVYRECLKNRNTWNSGFWFGAYKQ